VVAVEPEKNNLKRILVFQSVSSYGDSAFTAESEGPFGRAIYAYSDPDKALVGKEDPAELVIAIVNPENPEIRAKDYFVAISDSKHVKEVARFRVEEVSGDKKLSDLISESLPAPFKIDKKKTQASLVSRIASRYAAEKKKKKDKYKRVQLPLRTRLDYGVPKS
jgi:hypothetical protein